MKDRDKLQHLRGKSALTISKAKELGMLPGEIAIKHGTNGDSELYVLSQGGEPLVVVEWDDYDRPTKFKGLLNGVVYVVNRTNWTIAPES